MHQRILDIRFRSSKEFDRIWWDAGTPPLDRIDIEDRVRSLVEHYDPRVELEPVSESASLLELVVRSATSGYRYGMLFVDMGHVVDAIAYWRDPPLFADPATAVAHGLSRAHALRLALDRLELLR